MRSTCRLLLEDEERTSLLLGATIGCSNGPAPADPPSLPGCKSTASRELCLKGKLVRKSVRVRARVSYCSAFTRTQAYLVSGDFQGPALTIHNTNEDLGWASTLLGWTCSLSYASPAR